MRRRYVSDAVWFVLAMTAIGFGVGLSQHNRVGLALLVLAAVGASLLLGGLALVLLAGRSQSALSGRPVADEHRSGRGSSSAVNRVIAWYTPGRQVTWKRKAFGWSVFACFVLAVGVTLVVVFAVSLAADRDRDRVLSSRGVAGTVPVTAILALDRQGRPDLVTIKLPSAAGSQFVALDLSSSTATAIHVGSEIAVLYDPRNPRTVATPDVVAHRADITTDWGYIAGGLAAITVAFIIAGFIIQYAREKGRPGSQSEANNHRSRHESS